MAIYIVRTFDGPDLAIKADYYNTGGDTYEFRKKDGDTNITVASVNLHSTLAIIEEDSFQGTIDDETDSDDTCLDCRFQEFLESEEFFNEVYGIVEAYHSPDDYGDVPDPLPEPLTIYKATTPKFPEGAWGFWYADEKKGDVFVPFGVARSSAVAGLKRHNNGERGWDNAGWNTYPLSEATPVEEPVQ